MAEISSKFIDDYFEKRPQLIPPERGIFGYKIDNRWLNIVDHLLDIAGDTCPQQANKADAQIQAGVDFITDTSFSGE